MLGAGVGDEEDVPVPGIHPGACAEDEGHVLGGAGAAVEQQGVVGPAEQRGGLVHAAGRCPGDVVLGPHAGRGEAGA